MKRIVGETGDIAHRIGALYKIAVRRTASRIGIVNVDGGAIFRVGLTRRPSHEVIGVAS